MRMFGKRIVLAFVVVFLALAALSFVGCIVSVLLLRPILAILFFVGTLFFFAIAAVAGIGWLILRIL